MGNPCTTALGGQIHACFATEQVSPASLHPYFGMNGLWGQALLAAIVEGSAHPREHEEALSHELETVKANCIRYSLDKPEPRIKDLIPSVPGPALEVLNRGTGCKVAEERKERQPTSPFFLAPWRLCVEFFILLTGSCSLGKKLVGKKLITSRLLLLPS